MWPPRVGVRPPGPDRNRGADAVLLILDARASTSRHIGPTCKPAGPSFSAARHVMRIDTSTHYNAAQFQEPMHSIPPHTPLDHLPSAPAASVRPSVPFPPSAQSPQPSVHKRASDG